MSVSDGSLEDDFLGFGALVPEVLVEGAFGADGVLLGPAAPASSMARWRSFRAIPLVLAKPAETMSRSSKAGWSRRERSARFRLGAVCGLLAARASSGRERALSRAIPSSDSGFRA